MSMHPGMFIRKEIINKDGVDYTECAMCKELKPLEAYGKNRARWNGLNGACKVCHKTRKSNYYRDNKEYREEANNKSIERARRTKKECIVYKGSECQHCKVKWIENENDCIFQFHHIDPLQKDFAIRDSKSRNLESVKPELDKCIMLCANCHSIHHFKDWKLNGRAVKVPNDIT